MQCAYTHHLIGLTMCWCTMMGKNFGACIYRLVVGEILFQGGPVVDAKVNRTFFRPSALAETTALSLGSVRRSARRVRIRRNKLWSICGVSCCQWLREGGGIFSGVMCTRRIWMKKCGPKHSSTGMFWCITGWLYRRTAMQRHSLAPTTERLIPGTRAARSIGTF